jgi:hypothetical protein
MTICQQLTIDFEDEMINTRKLLERVPLDDARRAYRPHAKSMPLDRLATHVAEIPSWVKMALESPVFHLRKDFKPAIANSSAKLLEMFDRNVLDARGAIAAATDEQMALDWTFKFGDHFSVTRPRTKAIRSFLNHLAQLGVDLRLNEIAIPGMYGPSADEPRLS